jgi:hypothetical protein
MSQYEGNLTSRSFLTADQKGICALRALQRPLWVICRHQNREACSPRCAMKRHLPLQYHRVTHSSRVIPRLVFRC